MRLPYSADTVARSVCGKPQINMNDRNKDRASTLQWADYIATQHAKHPVPPGIEGKALGISRAVGKPPRSAWKTITLTAKSAPAFPLLTVRSQG